MFGMFTNKTMDEIIKTDNLSKQFGKMQAVDSVSISVKRGEIYGFLGLNGAGKTTTIRMLLSMIRPTKGNAVLFGKKVYPSNPELWNRVGYMVEVPFGWPDLTVRENLEIFRRMRFITDHRAVDAIMDKLKLAQYADRKAKHLSLGNAQRLGLAKALIHQPDLLILDEPANGLDPAGIVEIRELLYDLAFNHGVTIFVSSHLLNEISKFATRIGIIHQGRLIMESNIEELDKLRKRSLAVCVGNTMGAAHLLKTKGYDINFGQHGHLEICGLDAISQPENIAKILVNEGFPPAMLKVEEEDLETFFLRTIKAGGSK
jgi:ABC-2 type transport system ATP-binding protein